jgi:hypothetical protein
MSIRDDTKNLSSWQKMSVDEKLKIVQLLTLQKLSRKKIADRIDGATVGMITRFCRTHNIKSMIPPCIGKAKSTKIIDKVANNKIPKKKLSSQNHRTGFNYSGSYNSIVKEICLMREREVKPGIIMERFGINEEQLRGMCEREGIDPGFPRVKKKEVVPLPDDWKFHIKSATTECQWDIGEDPNAVTFCKRKTFGGSPYCREHASKAYPNRK